MKNIYYIIIACLGTFLLSSCESWLDVSPKSEIKETDVFSKESGFKSALIGQYLNMSHANLYGSNLSMGFIDVLAQYYEIKSEDNQLMSASRYDYNDQLCKPIIRHIWEDMYNVIVNLNNLLENIDAQKDIFTGDNYSIIKGEALGLRAFLHFDLLRMFAPSYAVNKDAPAIPYANKVSHTPFKQSSVAEVAEAAIADLLEALELLKDTDPIGPAFKSYDDGGSEFEEFDKDGAFLSHRRERMNYWAVMGTLARVYLYIDNKPKALEYAQKLMGTNRISPEGEIFEIYSNKTVLYGETYFKPLDNEKYYLEIPDQRRDFIYETENYGSIDDRWKSWFDYYPNTEINVVSKYMKKSDYVPQKIVLMRGCEAYYIAAEATTDSEKAFQYINRVRNLFGISSQYDLNPETADLDSELEKEYRKSYISEGQFFYYMKRKNLEGIEFSPITDFPKLYTLPIPDLELEFGNITDNK